jgi:archaellum component FlaC
MAANTATKIEEEMHLFALVEDDAAAVAIHLREVVRHLQEAREEVVRIQSTISDRLVGSPSSITPHSVRGVHSAAGLMLEEIGETEIDHLAQDSNELAELAALANKHARRLNGYDDA